MTLTQFLDKHRACAVGHKRAKAFASLDDAWQTCSPEDLIWAATRPGVLTDKELRLFAVYCARSVQHLMRDPRSIAAIDVAERYACGLATDDELRAAWFSAACAASAAALSAISAASAAASAADAAAAAARTASDRTAAREQQSAWLRQNTKPNFS